MVDDAGSTVSPAEAVPAAGEAPAVPAVPAAPAVPVCPWCSEPLPSIDAPACPSCGARLVGDEGVDIPGVTTVDPGLRAAAAAPRKVRRTFGSLLVGDDNEVPPPSEAEMPALAPPDLEVRREMLRLELEARLRELRAEVQAIDAEDRAEADDRADAVAASPPPGLEGAAEGADAGPPPPPDELGGAAQG